MEYFIPHYLLLKPKHLVVNFITIGKLILVPGAVIIISYNI